MTPLGNLKPGLTDDINHRASVRIAELAKKAGAGRFVFASSCSDYEQARKESFIGQMLGLFSDLATPRHALTFGETLVGPLVLLRSISSTHLDFLVYVNDRLQPTNAPLHIGIWQS